MYFWFYGLWKTWLNKCLKNPVSEDPLTSKMVNGPTHSSNWTAGPLSYLLIPVKRFRFKKSFWVIWKILGLFLNPLTAYNKYSLLQRQFIATWSDAITSETKTSFGNVFFFLHFLNFDSILKNCRKKKNDPGSWYIFEVTDSKIRG